MKPPTKPVSPPVYRPQPTPQVSQRKTAPQRTTASAKSAPGPTAPPVYRPQTVAKVLQRKNAPTASAARPPVSQTKFSPAAPPVYRPEPKKVLQPQRVARQTARPTTTTTQPQNSAQLRRVAPARKDGSIVMRHTDPRKRSPRIVLRSAVLQRAEKARSAEKPKAQGPASAALAAAVLPGGGEAKAAAAKAEVSDDEGVYYSNDKGASLPEALYVELHDIIRQYDAVPDEDVKRGSSAGKDITGRIGVGICNLLDFITRHGKGMEVTLDHVYHPHVTGPNAGRRNAQYKGKTFTQIVRMCQIGDQCNNELAQALRDCLSTLTPDE